jgi:4-amino-4-deoxy-L-arabinose transferase-like glycosyltransferase
MVNLVMNTLRKLEKNKLFWYLLGFLLIFFFLRLPSLIEPNWYGDEGIYQVIGQAINQGRMLYTEAFDNKPPLLYLTYALFAGDQFRVRIFSMIVGLVTVFAFFQLSLTLFRRQAASLFATLLFAILFAIPLIEGNIANAENFMLLPIITAGILIYKLSLKSHKPYTINRMPFLAGLLLGIAFLFKIVAIFDFAAFCIYLLIINFPNRLPSVKNNWPKIVLKHSMTLITPICVGFIAPVAISSIYFLLNGAFSDFIRASFLSNI